VNIFVGEAWIEREKRDRPECKMYVVTVNNRSVALAYKPGGTIAVTGTRADFERFWMRAPTYHKTQHPWRRQRLGRT
jgi:hypothetical protein